MNLRIARKVFWAWSNNNNITNYKHKTLIEATRVFKHHEHHCYKRLDDVINNPNCRSKRGGRTWYKSNNKVWYVRNPTWANPRYVECTVKYGKVTFELDGNTFTYNKLKFKNNRWEVNQ